MFNKCVSKINSHNVTKTWVDSETKINNEKRLALADPPDLVLMDVMMPELDGFEATRRLRRNDATRTVPIIVVTAMEGAQRIAAEAGADDFVAKPINTRLLLHKIQELLVRAAAGG